MSDLFIILQILKWIGEIDISELNWSKHSHWNVKQLLHLGIAEKNY